MSRLRPSDGRTALVATLFGGVRVNALALGVTVVSGVLSARSLSADGRGALAAILIAPNIAPYFFSLGVQRAVSYGVARTPKDTGKLLTAWLLILVPAAVVSVVVLEALTSILLHAQAPATQHLARIWALTVVFALYARLANGVLLGQQRFRSYYLVRLSQPVIVAGGYLGLWLAGALTLQLALVTNAAAGAASLAASYGCVLRRCRLSRPSAHLVRETVWYGVRSQGGELGASVSARLDALIIPALLGASQVGYYTVASNASWLLFTLAAPAAAVVLPAAVRQGPGSARAVVTSLHFTLAVGLAIGGALAVLAPVLVPAVYGGAFRPAVVPLEVLLGGTLAYALAAMLESGLGALGEPWRGSVAQLAGSVVTVVGLVVLLPRGGGILAAALVSTTAYLLVFIVALVLFKRTARLTWREFVPRWTFAGRSLPGRNPTGVLVVVGGVAVAVVAGRLVVQASSGLARLEPWTFWWLVLALCVIVLATNVHGLSRASSPTDRRLASSVVALGALAAVVLPGAQLLLGASQSRLAQYGLTSSNLDSSIAAAFAVFLVAIVAVWLGETWNPRRAVEATHARPDGALVYGALIVIALGTLVVTGGSSVVDRAAQGQGIQSLLGWGVPLAISIGILRRHWGSRSLAALSAGLAVLQLYIGNSRSPFFLIGIALGLRALQSARLSRRGLRTIAFLAGLSFLAVLLAIGISAWRYSVVVGQPTSITTSLGAAAKNPLHDFAGRTQLDTLEGMVISMRVDRREVGASWTDPTKALINFVPRKIWPTKPSWLGEVVTHRYLNIGGTAGVFLSGPGYIYILYGGAVGVGIAFFLLGACSRFVYSGTTIDSPRALLLTYFWMRFFFGGDAYDLFAVLGLGLLLVFARVLARSAHGLFARGRVSVFEGAPAG